MTQMVGKVEVRIVDPDGPAKLERHRTDSLAVAGDEMQLGGDHRLDLAERRWRVSEHAHAADVHMGDPVLQMEELGVERVHSLH